MGFLGLRSSALDAKTASDFRLWVLSFSALGLRFSALRPQILGPDVSDVSDISDVSDVSDDSYVSDGSDVSDVPSSFTRLRY